MLHVLENGKKINVPDKEIQKYMKTLELSQDDALHLWLADNDYEIDEEQEEMNEKAKKVKIQHDAVGEKPRKKSEKPRTVKVSDAKKELFYQLSEFFKKFCEENPATYSVLTENKLLQVNFNNETFKIDLIQQRKPKK